MHEMSIVEALLKTVCQELRAHPDARVRTLYVRIGRLRQVEPDMLQFCYKAAAQGTQLAGSCLEIEQVEARAVVTAVEPFLGDGHADARGDSLSERAGGGFNS